MSAENTWAGRDWSLQIAPAQVTLQRANGTEHFPGTSAVALSVVRRWLRWQLVVRASATCRLLGLSKSDALELRAALISFMASNRDREAREQHARAVEMFRPAVASVVAWYDRVHAFLRLAETDQRWITQEQLEDLLPAASLSEATKLLAQFPALEAGLAAAERGAVALLDEDLPALVARKNEGTLRLELTKRRKFFDTVETSPLTQEQARAVVCFDNRVHVVAAAGSGKTSVMVARAAYAIERGIVAPERILLLAFNKDAATELQERIATRLSAIGLDANGLRASTFHSFGLAVIGKATGIKPRLAPWLDGGQDVAMVCQIVDELRDSSVEFRYKWDLYRLLFARMADSPAGGEVDNYDRETKVSGFRTYKGQTVKSQGERMLADWLYLSGVNYEYERPYAHMVADRDHSQYRPDFYYPDVDVWHEHWALDRDGVPPASFSGYAESMSWKKQIHRKYGTTLVETTWAEIIDNSGFGPFSEELTRLGLTLDWNPDRTIPGAKPLKHEDLARLMRIFMAHVKSNSHTRTSLDKLLNGERETLATYRTKLFIDLYWAIHDGWQRRLQDEGAVDFEDMLVAAADHLESGRAEMECDLIMVDEFQDASHARARLTRGLVNKRGKYLLAVGDDWQSINRFAGADLSVMTEFTNWFGTGPTLRLETTFRCPQSICDTASSFISKNPRQLRKQVRSAQTNPGPPITLIRTRSADVIPAALEQHLVELAAKAERGEVSPGRHGRLSVDVLGRYGFERDVMPRRTPPALDVHFRTAHSSKGLEADYIVIPRMVSGTYGFPSEIVDDPVMDLVMATSDDFPHAEERRLFYVALTRARRSVTLITVQGQESPFVTELIKDNLLDLSPLSKGMSDLRVCALCSEGLMVQRTGPYGAFLGCSRYPKCRNSERSAP